MRGNDERYFQTSWVLISFVATPLTLSDEEIRVALAGFVVPTWSFWILLQSPGMGILVINFKWSGDSGTICSLV